MRSLRWVGLLFSLLIVGVLGGLMAPLPSEAATTPSLKLKVDSGAEVELIQTTSAQAVTACSSSEINPGGFNLCYRLKTGANSNATGGSPSRTYQVTSTTGAGELATLNIADTDGGVQKLKTSTLRIKPTVTDWTCSNFAIKHPPTAINCLNATETHIITLTLTVPFDHVADNNSTFQGLLLTEGNFYPIPATVPVGQTPYTVFGDTIELKGWGKFSSSDGTGTAGRAMTGDASTGKFWSLKLCSSCAASVPVRGPMRFQYGGTVAGSKYYGLTQTQFDYDSNSGTAVTYPIYTNCINANFSNKCAPTVTMTYTVTVYGPDTIELLTSNDLFWGGCDITNNKGGQNPQGPPCFSSSNKNGVNNALKDVSDASLDANGDAAIALGSTAGEQCVVDCPCAYDECKGTIVIALRHTNNFNSPIEFPFQATGPNIALPPDPAYNFLVTTIAGKKRTGQTPFENLFVGNLTAPWSFASLTEQFPAIPGFNGDWKVDNIDCTSLLNQPNAIPPIIVSTWTVDSGSDKRNATVTKLGKDDVVTCTYHAHKNG